MSPFTVDEAVRVERPPGDVFAAWSSASGLAAWFGPMAVRPTEVEMSFRAGGDYTITMDLGAAGVHVTTGRFLEIEPPHRLLMTWRCDAWEDPPSEVEVTFTPDGGGTVVRVRHIRIESTDARDGQQFGWTACLAALRSLLRTPDP